MYVSMVNFFSWFHYSQSTVDDFALAAHSHVPVHIPSSLDLEYAFCTDNVLVRTGVPRRSKLAVGGDVAVFCGHIGIMVK
jgi:hypothetical protein